MKNKSRTLWKIIWTVAFSLYLSYLLYLTFFSHFFGRGQFHRSLNLVPFRTIDQYLSIHYYGFAMINLLGNIAAFVPMGFLLPLITKKQVDIAKTVLFAGGISLMIEITQYTYGVGIADVDDLILNLAGAFLGYGLYKPCSNVISKFCAQK